MNHLKLVTILGHHNQCACTNITTACLVLQKMILQQKKRYSGHLKQTSHTVQHIFCLVLIVNQQMFDRNMFLVLKLKFRNRKKIPIPLLIKNNGGKGVQCLEIKESKS